MSITRKVWIEYKDEYKETSEIKPDLKKPIAIVGSSGLRSVGKIVIDYLVEKAQPQPELFAQLYSYGFPCIYYGPSYVCPPSAVGVETTKSGVVKLPQAEFYELQWRSRAHHDVIITKGYQANDSVFQYEVADKVTDIFKQLHVSKIISLGAQTLEEGIRCCATDVELVKEMNKYGIKKANVEQFIGFSALVVAIGKEKGLKGVCLFANTHQNTADVEYPDFNASRKLLEKISELWGLRVDTSDLEEQEKKRRVDEEEREDLRGYV
jgi:proteasome assembly chaperone (PAC2) family protein